MYKKRSLESSETPVLIYRTHGASRLKTVNVYVQSCVRLQDRVNKSFLKSNFLQNWGAKSSVDEDSLSSGMW